MRDIFHVGNFRKVSRIPPTNNFHVELNSLSAPLHERLTSSKSSENQGPRTTMEVTENRLRAENIAVFTSRLPMRTGLILCNIGDLNK